jgi:hypothetical protein
MKRRADVGGLEEDDPPIPDGEQLSCSRRSGTAPAPHGIAVAAMVYPVALMGESGRGWGLLATRTRRTGN